jgi:hypothetical protein
MPGVVFWLPSLGDRARGDCLLVLCYAIPTSTVTQRGQPKNKTRHGRVFVHRSGAGHFRPRSWLEPGGCSKKQWAGVMCIYPAGLVRRPPLIRTSPLRCECRSSPPDYVAGDILQQPDERSIAGRTEHPESLFQPIPGFQFGGYGIYGNGHAPLCRSWQST